MNDNSIEIVDLEELLENLSVDTAEGESELAAPSVGFLTP